MAEELQVEKKRETQQKSTSIKEIKRKECLTELWKKRKKNSLDKATEVIFERETYGQNKWEKVE